MKYVKTYESFIAENVLNEIGEGSKPFSWKRIGFNNSDTWMSDLSKVDKSENVKNWEDLPTIKYEFKSDKGTYNVRIDGGWAKNISIMFGGRKPGTPKPARFNLIIVVSFDVIGLDDTPITNFGEQFRVITTVTDITDNIVKEISQIEWVELKEIRIAPKLEDAEEGVPIAQSKRGRLYLEYIKKHGHRLIGDWTAEIDKEMFILKKGKWSSNTNTEKYIQL